MMWLYVGRGSCADVASSTSSTPLVVLIIIAFIVSAAVDSIKRRGSSAQPFGPLTNLPLLACDIMSHRGQWSAP